MTLQAFQVGKTKKLVTDHAVSGTSHKDQEEFILPMVSVNLQSIVGFWVYI